MSGITSGVGVFSGINSAQLIDQLISLEQRPKVQVQQRTTVLQQQRAAFLDINTALLSLRSASTKFRTANVFKAAKAESSDPTRLSATASNSASPGTYDFTIRRLVSTQQLLSRGFADGNTTAVGASSFTFELGGGGLATDTKLSELNGGNGVERGKIVIRDAAGNSSTVDLSTAVTVNDVIESINGASGVSVRASVDGDRLVVTDTNTSGTGALSISSAAGYNTASSLGIAGTASTGFGNALVGSRIRSISAATALSTLNGGSGVNFRDASDDLSITARDGTLINVKLGEIKTTTGTAPNEVTTVTQARSTTVGDVINAINNAAGGKVRAEINSDGTGLRLVDLTGSTSSNLIVRSAGNGRTTAADLGIETDVAGVAANQVAGRRLISSLTSNLVTSLRGGRGITESALTITGRDGVTANITLSDQARSGSVENLIKFVNAELQTAGTSARVSLNRAGNGLAVTDSGNGTGNLVVSGLAAQQLGINTTGATTSVSGANLQAKWFSRGTQLATLNGGRGIGTGTIRITDAAGGIATINIGEGQKSVDDLIQQLASAPGASFTVDVNDNGDGLIIRDTSNGTGSLKIEDVSGTVARSLNLVGTDDNDGGAIEINGSFERTVAFNTTDSLSSIVSKINAEGVGVTAALIRDGAGAAPFRLSLTSQRTGAAGRVIVDTGALDLNLSTLSRGEDSLAFYGNADPARAVLLSGSSNTLDNVIQGVSIDLRQAGTQTVSLTVSKDTEAVEKAFDEFVKAYNDVITRLDKYDNYDPETNRSGLLFGDGTVSSIRSQLLRTVQGTADGVNGSITRGFQLGLRVGEGSKLTLDKTKLRSAIESDPAAVESFLSARTVVPRNANIDLGNGAQTPNTSARDTFSALGLAEKLGELVSNLTSSVDGTITRRSRTIDNQVESNRDRIEVLDQRLAVKRARLEKQFADMEKAIGSLQGQSSALSSIRSVR